MAEYYIDRNLIEWYGCNYENAACENRKCSGCHLAECSHSQVMQIPTADVVEREKYDNLHNLAKSWLEEKKELEKANIELRSKIDKSIEEMMKDTRIGRKSFNAVLEIIKRNIGE